MASGAPAVLANTPNPLFQACTGCKSAETCARLSQCARQDFDTILAFRLSRVLASCAAEADRLGMSTAEILARVRIWAAAQGDESA